MMNKKIIRSPLFYTGDKYKLIGEIKKYFPKKINRFIEPFVGGGSVFLNVEADEFLLNDIDSNIMAIHKFLSSHKDIESLEKKLFEKIAAYNLSCSYKQNPVPLELREQFKKTYFAKYNKEMFQNLKNSFNNAQKKSIEELYLLLIYGFNRMLRFNSEGKYNVPVGNVDYNQNVHNALENYINLVNEKTITWENYNFVDFFRRTKFNEKDFMYLDPPYLITASEYNKLWNQDSDEKLLEIIDSLTKQNVKFAMSNVTDYKGKKNTRLIEWSKKYNVYSIKSNYINYHDNTKKTFSEVLITNYASS